jgi:hypothetical protein
LNENGVQWKIGGFKNTKEKTHSFHNPEGLHPELRRGLFKAGMSEVSQWSDRHLMTIQTTAKAIASGNKIFVGAGMREMVKWAVDNLFKVEGGE